MGCRPRPSGSTGATPSSAPSRAPPAAAWCTNEPARYGTLHHPGDQYALDMYAQIGNALKVNKNVALRGLHPTHYVAVGESQSAFYLTTFADAIQPLTNTFDGIFIHSRGGSGAPLNGTAISVRGPNNLRIRTDLKRAGLHVRDPDRSHPARLRPGPTAQYEADPHLGGGGHIARRRLRGGPGSSPFWVVPPRSTPARSTRSSRPPLPPSPSGSTTGHPRRARPA